MPYKNLDKLDKKEKKSTKPPKEELAPTVVADMATAAEEEDDVPQAPTWEPYQEAGILTPLERKRMDELSQFNDITAIVRIVSEVSDSLLQRYKYIYIYIYTHTHINTWWMLTFCITIL
jgi:hypothetical protein